VTDRGAVVFQTGKIARRGEGPAFSDAFRKWGIPVLGIIDGEATAEGGDMIWLDHDTLLVGRGFRTNAAGIRQLSTLLAPLGVTVIAVELPYWNGPNDVLHLMSFISLLDTDLAVVYRRILPVPLFELLTSRGVKLVDVPEQEYDSLGCNVLAIAPRRVVMAAGNSITRSRLEAAGCIVSEFDGREICLPGAGGPTCLTRPLWRD
jgi:N-dimethylarginine dimethylaminohydrolase